MSVLNKPKVEAYIGGTGSGKGVSIGRRLRELKPRRLLIWDPRGEYGKVCPAAPSLPHLVGAFKHAKGGPVRVRYVCDGRVPLEEAFGLVCNLAFEAGDVVFVAEELSDVTKASWAPPAWRRCITQGRHKGLHLIGATQRPALIDKSFLSAATQVRCFMLGYQEDQRTMARELNVPEADVQALVTTEDEATGRTTIRYLERLRRSRELYAGQITINGDSFAEKRQLHGQEATPAPKRGRGAT